MRMLAILSICKIADRISMVNDAVKVGLGVLAGLISILILILLGLHFLSTSSQPDWLNLVLGMIMIIIAMIIGFIMVKVLRSKMRGL